MLAVPSSKTSTCELLRAGLLAAQSPMTPTASNPTAPPRITALFLGRFQPMGVFERQPFAWLRARVVGLLIRGALMLGFRVLVVGACRAGKSYLLERTFSAGRLFDGAAVARTGKGPTPLDLATLPRGAFAIEEPQAIKKSDLSAAIDGLQSRRFAMSMQDISMVRSLGLEPLFAGRRTLVLFIGPVRSSHA